MLLVEQRVEQALRCWRRLTPQRAGPDRMHDDRVRGLDDPAARVRSSAKWRSLSSRQAGGEALVEAADGLQRVARHEAVGGDELGPFQARGVALVVGRALGQRHDDAARHGRDVPSVEGGDALPPASAGRGCNRRR